MCASPINDVYSLLGLPITSILLLFTLNLPQQSSPSLFPLTHKHAGACPVTLLVASHIRELDRYVLFVLCLLG